MAVRPSRRVRSARPDVGLPLNAAQYQLGVVAGGQLGVPGHVPGRRPSTGPGAATSKSPRCSGDVAQRPSSSRTLAYERSSSLSSSRSGAGSPTSSVHLGAAHRRRPARSGWRRTRPSAVHRSYSPIAIRCGAQRRLRSRAGLLADGERGDSAVVADLDLRAQDVDAGGLQPLLRPGRQITAAGLLQRAEQIGQRGVAAGVRAKYAAQPGEELVLADLGDQLLEHARRPWRR